MLKFLVTELCLVLLIILLGWLLTSMIMQHAWDAFKINLPEEFLNSGESTVAVTSYANDGNEAIKYSVTKGIINLNTMTQSFVDKESMFTPANSIISDEYTNLVEVAPSEWVEKDNINEILREITTWRATANPYIPDVVTEESIKTHSEFHEIKPDFSVMIQQMTQSIINSTMSMLVEVILATRLIITSKAIVFQRVC